MLRLCESRFRPAGECYGGRKEMEGEETGAEWPWSERRDRRARTDLTAAAASCGPARPNSEEAELGLWFGEIVGEGEGGREEEGEGRGLSFG